MGGSRHLIAEGSASFYVVIIVPGFLFLCLLVGLTLCFLHLRSSTKGTGGVGAKGPKEDVEKGYKHANANETERQGGSVGDSEASPRPSISTLRAGGKIPSLTASTDPITMNAASPDTAHPPTGGNSTALAGSSGVQELLPPQIQEEDEKSAEEGAGGDGEDSSHHPVAPGTSNGADWGLSGSASVQPSSLPPAVEKQRERIPVRLQVITSFPQQSHPLASFQGGESSEGAMALDGVSASLLTPRRPVRYRHSRHDTPCYDPPPRLLTDPSFSPGGCSSPLVLQPKSILKNSPSPRNNMNNRQPSSGVEGSSARLGQVGDSIDILSQTSHIHGTPTAQMSAADAGANPEQPPQTTPIHGFASGGQTGSSSANRAGPLHCSSVSLVIPQDPVPGPLPFSVRPLQSDCLSVPSDAVNNTSQVMPSPSGGLSVGVAQSSLMVVAQSSSLCPSQTGKRLRWAESLGSISSSVSSVRTGQSPSPKSIVRKKTPERFREGRALGLGRRVREEGSEDSSLEAVRDGHGGLVGLEGGGGGTDDERGEGGNWGSASPPPSFPSSDEQTPLELFGQNDHPSPTGSSGGLSQCWESVARSLRRADLFTESAPTDTLKVALNPGEGEGGAAKEEGDGRTESPPPLPFRSSGPSVASGDPARIPLGTALVCVSKGTAPRIQERGRASAQLGQSRSSRSASSSRFTVPPKGGGEDDKQGRQEGEARQRAGKVSDQRPLQGEKEQGSSALVCTMVEKGKRDAGASPAALSAPVVGGTRDFNTAELIARYFENMRAREEAERGDAEDH
uniref:Transmembrane protein n=1 Tax=Chromera velia CCMP2878 TaxID=1169474 RepID=A0A0G4FKA8_9ALVE|eukprot:Cvel_17477.t1-p1 / transcript=Cvel_17477.t1 / gene=Cvel_17477 / organism=Chromera_velia_CCMP2878 / gene_product=hypothetical protein / transcript_product=hypothetical protein / location=Cvel_scaffold1397:27339-30613(-) / protein_length=791 / sequence_SO=supercontig / SO=protein_coding / is_pseudo=false